MIKADIASESRSVFYVLHGTRSLLLLVLGRGRG
jgi:hypothetical protein